MTAVWKIIRLQAPPGTVGVKAKLENSIENRFTQNVSPFVERLQTKRIYPQLPVFSRIPLRKKRVFTGGTSAIDLWAISGSTLAVIELNAQNKMVGAATELFLYANYAYDMFVRQGNRFHPDDRGGGLASCQKADGWFQPGCRRFAGASMYGYYFRG